MGRICITFVLVALLTVVGWVGRWVGQGFMIDDDYGMSRLLNGWHDPRFATFQRLFREIEIGMSRDEVGRVVARVYPAAGPRIAPGMTIGDAAILIEMNSESRSEGTCEMMSVVFSDGRVVSKSYAMD